MAMVVDDHADDGENYFATMTDMMVGLLFIFLIMVAFFAYKLSLQAEREDGIPLSQYERVVQERDELLEEVSQLNHLLENLRRNSLARFNQESRDNRRQVLLAIRERVSSERPDLDLSIDFKRGILRLQGVDLFASSSTRLLNPATVSLLAQALRDELGCYIYSESKGSQCDGAIGYVETVYVEGHTDSVPMNATRRSDGISNNLQLSTRRANNTYETLITAAPELVSYLNPARQSVMSVAGYGSQRPIAKNTSRTGRARNRRIDIRVEMYSPRDEAEMERLLSRNAAEVSLEDQVNSIPQTRLPEAESY